MAIKKVLEDPNCATWSHSQYQMQVVCIYKMAVQNEFNGIHTYDTLSTNLSFDLIFLYTSNIINQKHNTSWVLLHMRETNLTNSLVLLLQKLFAFKHEPISIHLKT